MGLFKIIGDLIESKVRRIKSIELLYGDKDELDDLLYELTMGRITYTKTWISISTHDNKRLFAQTPSIEKRDDGYIIYEDNRPQINRIIRIDRSPQCETVIITVYHNVVSPMSVISIIKCNCVEYNA